MLTNALQTLLHTKLMPPRLPSAVVPRDELFARLDAGLAKKASLVTAPTGFGKTTLVGMWIASRGVPSAWLTLDEHDHEPIRFWTYVGSAVLGREDYHCIQSAEINEDVAFFLQHLPDILHLIFIARTEPSCRCQSCGRELIWWRSRRDARAARCKKQGFPLHESNPLPH
jgi:LuxR family maltose regulon positive regulatory protein